MGEFQLELVSLDERKRVTGFVLDGSGTKLPVVLEENRLTVASGTRQGQRVVLGKDAIVIQ